MRGTGSRIFICFVVVLSSSVLGCKDGNILRDPDTETIRATLKTAVPLARVAAISMAAVQNQDNPGVSSSNSCFSFPCAAIVTIDPSSQLLPFAIDSVGVVKVAGLWTSSGNAILTVSFNDMRIGIPSFPVIKISTIPVVKSDNPTGGYTVVYASTDINVEWESSDSVLLTNEEIQAEYDRTNTDAPRNLEVSLNMDAWIVQYVDGGTPNDVSDDTYSISGGGQYVDVTSDNSPVSNGIIQLGMVGVTITPGCIVNPTSGLAVIQEAGTASSGLGSMPFLGQATMIFEPECNGSVRVLLATGNYVGAIGSQMPLILNHP